MSASAMTQHRRFVFVLFLALVFSFAWWVDGLFPHPHVSQAQAAEAKADKQRPVTPQPEAQDKTAKEPPKSDPKAKAKTEPALSSAALAAGGAPVVGAGMAMPMPDVLAFTGAATVSVPIDMPPGRAGVAPRLAITYNSYRGNNGALGVGWDIDMGAIQRSTKHGLNYRANDFVATIDGSTSELVPRSDFGANCYGSKVEGAFSKYCFRGVDGWEVTSKDGTRYLYGTSSVSRQENRYGVFKWCLTRVEDTNGNYLEVTYSKDRGELYLAWIEYTGNTASNLAATNYVQFYYEGR